MAGQPILVASWTMRAPAWCQQSRALRERIRISMGLIGTSMRLGSPATACFLLAAAAGPARGAVKSVDRGKGSLKRGFSCDRYRPWRAFACDIVHVTAVCRLAARCRPGLDPPLDV